MLVFLFAYLLALGEANLKDVNDELPSNRKSLWLLYTDPKNTQMVLITKENGIISDCYVSGDDYLIRSSLEKVHPASVMILDNEDLFELSDYCTWAKMSMGIPGSSGAEVHAEFGILSGLFIYPGTKWCGAGNVSQSYDDLGPEREADICCREHDYCNDSIEAFGSKYELQNFAPYTKSHCTCDDEFYNCLRKGNTRASNRIGSIYFNFLQADCFKLEHPIKGCKRYAGWFRPRCQEYVLDKEEEPVWDFFDAKDYTPTLTGIKFISKTQDAFDYILATSWKSLPTNNVRNKDLYLS